MSFQRAANWQVYSTIQQSERNRAGSALPARQTWQGAGWATMDMTMAMMSVVVMTMLGSRDDMTPAGSECLGCIYVCTVPVATRTDDTGQEGDE